MSHPPEAVAAVANPTATGTLTSAVSLNGLEAFFVGSCELTDRCLFQTSSVQFNYSIG
jgi:hypothetical protein